MPEPSAGHRQLRGERRDDLHQARRECFLCRRTPCPVGSNRGAHGARQLPGSRGRLGIAGKPASGTAEPHALASWTRSDAAKPGRTPRSSSAGSNFTVRASRRADQAGSDRDRANDPSAPTSGNTSAAARISGKGTISGASRAASRPQAGMSPAGIASRPASSASKAARAAVMRRLIRGSAPTASSVRCSWRDSASPRATATAVTLKATSRLIPISTHRKASNEPGGQQYVMVEQKKKT